MGWASGSHVANGIWFGIRNLIPKENQRAAARIIVSTLRGEDWDTLDESIELCMAAGLYGEVRCPSCGAKDVGWLDKPPEDCYDCWEKRNET